MKKVLGILSCVAVFGSYSVATDNIASSEESHFSEKLLQKFDKLRVIQQTNDDIWLEAKINLSSNLYKKMYEGAQLMVRLYNDKYGPAVELFDNICDIRGKIDKPFETLMEILSRHYSAKKSGRLGGWEEEEEEDEIQE